MSNLLYQSSAVNTILDLSADWIPSGARPQLSTGFQTVLVPMTFSEQQFDFCTKPTAELRRSGNIKNRDEGQMTPTEITALVMFKAL
ncbi:unnamed protein product [Umbelopsis vinacea]